MIITRDTILTYTNANGLSMTLGGDPGSCEYLVTNWEDDIDHDIVTEKIGDLDGEEVTAASLGPRTVEISGIFNTYKNKRLMAQTLKKVFNAADSEPGVLAYENKVEKNRYWMSCRLESMPQTPFEGMEVHFTINLIAHNPYWKTRGESFYLTQVQKMGRFPLVIPRSGFIFGARARVLSAVFNNIGDARTGATYTFKADKGTVKNPSITHTKTGETIKIFYDMEHGDEIKVISEPDYADVFVNGKSGFRYLTDQSKRKFFTISQGKNIIAFDADENVSNLSIKAEYEPLFVEVL